MAAKSLPLQNSERKKLGFPVPLNEWIKEEQYYQPIKELFNSKSAQKYFNCDYLNYLLDEHYQGIHNNARKIWNHLYFSNFGIIVILTKKILSSFSMLFHLISLSRMHKLY